MVGWLSFFPVHPTKSHNIEIRFYYEKTFRDRGSGFVDL